MQIRVAVIGAGSWGTTIATLAAANAPTVLWARDEALARAIDTEHRNRRYLPDFALNPALRTSSSIGDVVAAADVLVMAVPAKGFRTTLEAAAPHLRPWVPIVSLAKGLEQGTGLRMTRVAEEVCPGHPAGVLTGPNLAKEILAGQAAAAVLAMSDDHIAERLQRVFSAPCLRVYTNPDVVGCEIAGALKNVIAVAAGMADGLGAGDNTKAAIITRGLTEITRLGVAMGGDPLTFAGLAGMGDLIATSISPQSRNRFVGEQLGRGRPLSDIIAEMDQVAEGVSSVREVKELGDEYGVDLPIVEQVYAVVVEGRPAGDAYHELMARKVGRERFAPAALGSVASPRPDRAPARG
jgi:glycerol-3-phosphate dehydrogenase (NAD(P)+)